jgi:hypothetical protein
MVRAHSSAMQKTQCFHWVFSFDAHWFFVPYRHAIPPPAFQRRFFTRLISSSTFATASACAPSRM